MTSEPNRLEDRPPSLREFAYHAHHNRKGAGLSAGIVLGLALLVAAWLPPSFRAVATLAILPSPEFTVRAAAGSHELNASALAMDQIMKAETEILGSESLHQVTLEKIGPAVLYPEIFQPEKRGFLRNALHVVSRVLLAPWRVAPEDEQAARDQRGVARFGSALTVLPAKDANVINVYFDHRSGLQAAEALNTLLGLYAIRRTRLYDDPQLSIVRREAEAGALAVRAADERLAQFKRDHAISDYGSQRDLLLRRRSVAEQAAQDSEVAAGEHSARLAALTKQLGDEPAVIGLYTEQDADSRLTTLNADLEAMRAKLAVARQKYRDSSRMVATLRAEQGAYEAEQRRLTQDSTLSVVRRGRNPAIDPLRLDRSREVAELAATRARLAAQQNQVLHLTTSLDALDAEEASLASLERERASADESYRTASRILAERHLSEAEEASRLANVRVIQPAIAPQSPKPIKPLIAIAGLLLSLIVFAGWIIVAYLRKPVFLTAEGLAAAIDLPVLAVFQQVDAASKDSLVSV